MTTVKEVCEMIMKLTPAERYRLGSYLFEKNEAALDHLVIRSGVASELDEDPVKTEPFKLELVG